MKFLLKIAALSALFGLTGSIAAQTDTVVTKNGALFVGHKRNGGPTPKTGDYVYLIVDSYVGDTLMASTASMGGPREVQIPTSFPPGRRVPAVLDAMSLMAKGDSATVLQQIDSMTARAIPPALQTEKYVRYEIVLTDFVTAEMHAARRQAKEEQMTARRTAVETQTRQLAEAFRKGELKNQLTKTATGLQYFVHDPGTGQPVRPGENIAVHYYGCFNDGKSFDDSFTRGEPLLFTVGEGQMIAGFDEGALLLRHGAKATLFLPYRLAYGEQGAGDVIPPKTDLIFYIEIQ